MLREFARTMVTDFALEATLDRLVQQIVDVLPITAARITIIAPGTDPRCAAASDPSAFDAPAIDGAPGALFRFPLRHGDRLLGALDLYDATAEPLDAAATETAQTLADVVSAYLVNAQTRADLGDSFERTQGLAAIVESSSDSIISWSVDGVITSWNSGSERMYGYTANEAVDRDFSLIVPPGQVADISHIHALVRRGETVEPLETQRVRKDGTVLDVSVTVSPVRDRTGTIVGLSAVARDISERKAQEAARAALEDRLRQAQRLESLGQLAGGIAHDFNNLLAVIVNYASFVAEAIPAEAEAQEDVQHILSATRRAATLTRQLLMFARRETIHAERLDLNDIVENVRGVLAHSIGEEIELVVHADPTLPAISADRGQTEQLLLNLAVNARDAMPQGGTLTISTESVALADDVDERAASPGRGVQLSVRDNGVGMSPAVAAQAFDPFFTTKAKTEGTGLGLATVYGIVTEAGGTVSLHSEEGVGTTVRVCFPATAVAAAPIAAAISAAPAGGSGEAGVVVHGDADPSTRRPMRLLIVEDDQAVRQLVTDRLETQGIVVTTSATAASGFRELQSARFDIAILDLTLPDGSGLDLLRAIRVSDARTHVIMLSGAADEADRVRALTLGADDYVVKPFFVRELTARVLAVVRRQDVDDHSPLCFGNVVIDVGARQLTVGDVLVALTAKEFDLLAFLAARPGQTFTRDELLRSVWHSTADWQNASTVTEHVRRLRIKIGPRDSRLLLRTVRGVGYRLDPPPVPDAEAV